MKKASIALMILVVAAALNGCTYSSGAKVASGTTNPTDPTNPTNPTNPTDPTNPTTPTTPTPPAPPAGTPTPVAPTNPAPIAIPPAGTETTSLIQGTWNTLPVTMPVNPVHGILLTTGNVLYIEFNGRYAEYTGTVRGDRMAGNAINVTGLRWTWSFQRQERPLPADR